VRVGPYKFKKVPAFIFRDDFNVTSYPHLGGLIGNDLLRRFNLIINYGESLIHLLPNTHFSDPFDYSYIGLGIFFVDGNVVVEDVMEDSPGEKAGFLPGDIILGVEGNFSGNIQAYKALLQVAGAKLKVVVLRDNAPIIFTLKVASILAK
jgi:predicted metalloprotease with PDZ domain